MHVNPWTIGAGVIGAGALALGTVNVVRTAGDEPKPGGLDWEAAASIAVPLGVGLGAIVGGAYAARTFASGGVVNSIVFGSAAEMVGRYGVGGAMIGGMVGGAVAGPLSAIA